MSNKVERILSIAAGLGFGLMMGGAVPGCNDTGADCSAGQAGCECVGGLCAAGLECVNGLCFGDGGTGSGDGDGDSGDGDGAPGDGDGAPGDGDGDTGEIPGESCPGEAFGSSGVLELDLGVARISGQITLDGQTMPDWVSNRGSIVFTDLEQNITGTYTLGSVGAAGYALALPEGTYEVSFVGNPSACSASPSPAFPCNRGILASNLQLQSDASLNFDLRGVTLVGGVTMDGQPLPDATSSRGQIGFYSDDNLLAISEGLGASGPAAYSITLFPGTYEARWIGNTSLCTNAQASSVPCNSGLMAAGISVQQSGNLDVNVTSVSLSGQVRVNGATMPDESSNRGSVMFDNEYGIVNTAGFGSFGPASYSIRLVADSYDIRWNGNENLCSSGPSVACNDGILESEVSLLSSGSFDVDVPAVKLSGGVTLNGAAAPDQSSNRGALSFTNSEGLILVSQSFGSTGPINYTVTLLADTYTIGLFGNLSLCSSASSVEFPCMSGPLVPNLALAQSGALDIDIPAVKLLGSVTVNEQPLSDWTSNRGGLSFTTRTNAPGVTPGVALSNDFSTTGPGSYTVTVLPGVYDIGWKAGGNACSNGAAPVPCVDGPISQDMTLNASGNLDFDADLIALSGPVLLAGAAMPDAAGNRGSISFRHVEGGTTVLPSFGTTGPVTYQISVLPGDYVISHVANPSLCGGASSPQVPCASQVLRGCD